MNKNLINWAIFWLGIVFILWTFFLVSNAAWNETKSTWDGTASNTKLTAADYNDLVDEVKKLNTNYTSLTNKYNEQKNEINLLKNKKPTETKYLLYMRANWNYNRNYNVSKENRHCFVSWILAWWALYTNHSSLTETNDATSFRVLKDQDVYIFSQGTTGWGKRWAIWLKRSNNSKHLITPWDTDDRLDDPFACWVRKNGDSITLQANSPLWDDVLACQFTCLDF